jgi:competence protein ComEC
VVRLSTLAFAFAAGVLAAEASGPFRAAPAPWVCALALVVLAVRGRPRWIAAAAIAGAIAVAARGAPVPLAGADDREPDVVRGVVARAAATGGVDVDSGGARVRVWTDVHLAPGDRVEVLGRLRTARGYANEGERARDGYAMTAIEVRRLGAEPGLGRWADGVQRAWAREIDGTSQAAAIVRGAVVGDRRAISEDTNARWRAAGVFHVLSVSGLHLAVVALLGFGLVRRIVAGLGVRRHVPPARLAAVPAIGAACAYTAITGGEVATLRALVVVIVVVLGAAIGRAARIGDAIGAAAIALLAARPELVHDISFQLSFTAAGVLAGLGRGRGGWIRRGLVASAWVTAATAPFTAAAFGQIAWGGLAGNLVVTPIIELLVIPATLFGLVVPLAIGRWLVGAAVAVTAVIDRLVAAIATVTPVVTVVPPTTAELVAWTAAWLVPFLAYTGRLRRWRLLALVALAACVGLRAARWTVLAHDGDLVVTFLDVGQGDAAVIETPDGQTWLVDAGGDPGVGLARGAAPGKAVARFLAARGRTRLDLVIVSHPHPDHYLGLLALADAVAVDTVLVAVDPDPQPDGAFAHVLARLRAAGARVVVPPLGLAAAAGGARLEVLAPRYRPDGPPLVAAGDPVRSVNDNSLVVAVAYAGRRVLFLGDLEEEGEHELAAAGLARADVVKVAHHGSATSSTAELVAATGAEIAVISCGRGNRFGFPRAIALERWVAAGARVLRTDTAGAVTVTVDPVGAIATTTRRLDGGPGGAL